MERFLFTDGSNGVNEAASLEELKALINATEQPERCRIWLYSTNEWISYASFILQFPAARKTDILSPSTVIPVQQSRHVPSLPYVPAPATRKRKPRLVNFLFLVLLAAGAFLIFNFTRVTWKEATPLAATAIRPANMPVMDIDSLIGTIEATRGQSLDRSTKTNLRLRNTWPELISLQVNADRETSNAGSRFFNVDVSIDNSTGNTLDNAVVRLNVWKDKKITLSDTLRFSNIRYDKIARRQLDYRYRGDSLSVSFESIRSKSFNFCYNASTKNNPGDYNDRWFCRE